MFDVDRDERIFKLQPRGFRGIDFGPVAQTGLTNSFVASDLCVTATKLPNGVLPAEYLYPDAGLVPMSCGNAGEAINMNVNYVAATGDLLIDWADVETGGENGGALAAEKANLFTTVEVRSASGVFTGERPISLRGPYDRFERHRILKQDPAGFDRIYLPQAIQPGLSEEFLKGDLTIDITTLGANRLGEVLLSVATVPEPNCVSCVVIGLVAFGLHGRPHRHV